MRKNGENYTKYVNVGYLLIHPSFGKKCILGGVDNICLSTFHVSLSTLIIGRYIDILIHLIQTHNFVVTMLFIK